MFVYRYVYVYHLQPNFIGGKLTTAAARGGNSIEGLTDFYLP